MPMPTVNALQEMIKFVKVHPHPEKLHDVCFTAESIEPVDWRGIDQIAEVYPYPARKTGRMTTGELCKLLALKVEDLEIKAEHMHRAIDGEMEGLVEALRTLTLISVKAQDPELANKVCAFHACVERISKAIK